MNKKLKTFLINSLILTVSSIIFRVLAVFFNGYISKKIGKEMLGEFNLIMSVYIFGITLGNFGISFSVTRLVSEELAFGNKDGILKIIKHCIFISFICGIVASTLIFINSDFIIKVCLHNKTSKNVIYLICLALPFISISSAISGYFVAVRRVYKSTIAEFFEEIIKIFVTAFFLNLFLPNGLEYACFSLILGDFISELFSCLCNYILYIKDCKIYKTSYITNYKHSFYNKKILKIATPVAITSLLRSGLSTIKQIIIPFSFEKGKMECSKALSIYGEINGMAMPIVLFPNVLFSSISSLLVPEFATYYAKRQKNIIRHITKTIFIIFFTLSILVSIFLFLYADFLGSWIYNDNNISYYIKILSPIAIFILLDCVIDNILKGLDAQNDVMIINILDLLINIFTIYIFVPKLGMNGYIFSMYFSEIFNITLSMSKLLKIIYLSTF